jgi:hypothetical protein
MLYQQLRQDTGIAVSAYMSFNCSIRDDFCVLKYGRTQVPKAAAKEAGPNPERAKECEE